MHRAERGYDIDNRIYSCGNRRHYFIYDCPISGIPYEKEAGSKEWEIYHFQTDMDFFSYGDNFGITLRYGEIKCRL